MSRIDGWRDLKQYSAEDNNLVPGDLVRRKHVALTERVYTPKVGIILSVGESGGAGSWLKMATVAWSGTSDIEEVATIYLQRISNDNDEAY